MRGSPDVALSTLAAVIPHVANPALTHAKSGCAGSVAAAGNAAGWVRAGHQRECAVSWAPCRLNLISILLTCSSTAVSPISLQSPPTMPTMLSRDNGRPSRVSRAAVDSFESRHEALRGRWHAHPGCWGPQSCALQPRRPDCRKLALHCTSGASNSTSKWVSQMLSSQH